MNRLPLALMWLLALTAGGLPAIRLPAAWRAHASIVPADLVDACSLFKPVRAERVVRDWDARRADVQSLT